jgi:hypothetical protein
MDVEQDVQSVWIQFVLIAMSMKMECVIVV